MEIPPAILDKAKDLIATYGVHFERLGLYNGCLVFKYVFPKGLRTGFPYVFLYDEKTKKVEEITGIEALEIIISMKQ